GFPAGWEEPAVAAGPADYPVRSGTGKGRVPVRRTVDPPGSSHPTSRRGVEVRQAVPGAGESPVTALLANLAAGFVGTPLLLGTGFELSLSVYRFRASVDIG